MKYTFLVKENKTLLPTSKIVINQNDNNADTLVFILPKYYGGMDMTDCFVTLKCITAGNQTIAELLSTDGELYKDNYYLYTYLIDTNFSDVAGKVKIQLEIQKNGKVFTINEFPLIVKHVDAAFTNSNED